MSEKSSVFLAHVRQNSNGQWVHHHLEDHLHGVAGLAESFAAAFSAGDWGQLAGLWHDLGKYQKAFQNYICSASGYDAHIEPSPEKPNYSEAAQGKVDHSTAGEQRFIPTHMGNGVASWDDLRRAAVHPHAYGERAWL